ncbi:MAG: carbon-nitrogen hydrolase family protein [Planctomycetota bacterium]
MQTLQVALAQMSPVWLQRQATTEKIVSFIEQAASKGCDLVTFGEALLPGYPFWLEWTEGAKFESARQKEFFAHYAESAVVTERGDLDPICAAAKTGNCMVVVGTIERATDRGGHSLYCSLVSINKEGEIVSVHRKLMPTYEERLVWSPGDGHGLRTHRIGQFCIGSLNCWENWMPLPRAALYAQGENVHVASWPGAVRNTKDITRFIAKESRSFVISVSGQFAKEDIPAETPSYDLLMENCPPTMADGGSCIAGPDGQWIIEPSVEKDVLLTASLDLQRVFEARQNFDPSGHYSRPDVTTLQVNRKRRAIVEIEEE